MRANRRGITLVETLVVCGIAGLLLALVGPTYLLVRESARRTECRSNLSQIGKGLGMYYGSNRGRLPGGTIIRADLSVAEDPAMSVPMMLDPFLGKGRGVYACPGDEVLAVRCGGSYAYRGPPESGVDGGASTYYADYLNRSVTRVMAEDFDGTTLVVLEASGRAEAVRIPAFHRGGARNRLYADGHVAE